MASINLKGLSSLAFICRFDKEDVDTRLSNFKAPMNKDIQKEGSTFLKDSNSEFKLEFVPARLIGFPNRIHIKFAERSSIDSSTFGLLVNIAKKLDVALYLRNFVLSPHQAVKLSALAAINKVPCILDKQTTTSVQMSKYARQYELIREITSGLKGRDLLCAESGYHKAKVSKNKKARI